MAYRPTSRTRAHAADVRRRIVAAAHDQIAEGGYASAAVQVVARRAGVATGSVYRHFPSKSELFAEVFRRAAQREVDAVAVAAADGQRPVAERIAAAVEVFVRRALMSPARAYALLAEPVDPAIEAQRLVFRRAYADLFAGILRDGVARGEVPPLDADLVAAALVGGLGEALVGPLARRERGEEQLVEALRTFCVAAIGSRAPASSLPLPAPQPT